MTWSQKALLFLFIFCSATCITLTGAQFIDQEFEIGSEADCNGTQQRFNKSQGVLIFPPEENAYYFSDCSLLLTVGVKVTNRPVELQFLHYNIGVGDSVTISDVAFGGSYNEEFSELREPGDVPIIIGYTEAFQVSVRSDSLYTGTGFKLSWGIVYTTIYESTTTELLLPRDTVYKSVVKDKEYTLKSPNYPGNYPKDKMLYWVLTAADPNDRIKLIFQDFQLALDDSLYIYDGSLPQEESLKKKHSGDKTSLPGNIVSKRDQLLVIFESTKTVTDKGFSIKYLIFVANQQDTEVITYNTPISNNKKKTAKPLTPEGRAAIIVASCLLLLVIAIVGFYYVYWKPKQRQEEQLIARELYDNGKNTLSQDDLPQRPATANELARLRAERPATANELARLRAQQHMKPDYGFANSVVDENGQPIPIRLPIPQLPPGAEGGRPPSAANRNRAAGPSVKFDPSLNEDIVEQSEWSQKLDQRFSQRKATSGAKGLGPSKVALVNSNPQTGAGTLPPLEIEAVNSKPVKMKKKKKEKNRAPAVSLQKELDELGAIIIPDTPRSTGPSSGRPNSARPNSGRPTSARRDTRSPTAPTTSIAKLPGYVKRANEDDE